MEQSSLEQSSLDRPAVNYPVIYSDENTIPMPGLPDLVKIPHEEVDDERMAEARRIVTTEFINCIQSYNRDFSVENSNLKKEMAERPGVPPMRLEAFGGRAAILKRRVKLNKKKYPIMRLYKCVDIESEQEMYESDVLPQQSDDQMKCVITCTDLTLDDTIREQFSDDDSRFNVFIINPRSLLIDGWTPLYDRGYVYWYPPIIDQYLYGSPEFHATHILEQCVDY